MNKYVPFAAVALLLSALVGHSAVADDNAEIFKKLDVDANGLITKDEAEANTSIAGSFDDGDSNEDGMLDMDEFAKMEVVDE